jgi:TIR domain
MAALTGDCLFQIGQVVISVRPPGGKRLVVGDRASAAFFSYCREDSDFALRLAEDLKAAGASVWLDQLDIVPGQHWDRAVEDALTNCPRTLVILSPASVNSTNVLDEVSFALEKKKTAVPVIHKDCAVPFRLRRVQYVDFRHDYARGLKELLKTLPPGQKAAPGAPASSNVPRHQADLTEADERERAAEEDHRRAAESTHLDEERKQAAEQDLFGIWFGVSGRLVLSAGDKPGSVKGKYDWKHIPMVGHIDGYLDGKALKFQWSWDKTREHGNGYLLLNDSFTRLEGGWFYHKDAADLDEAIRGSEAARELMSAWSFSRELTPQTQE